MEKIEAGQAFDVVVDYAHTPESLEAAYQAIPGKDLICVLGATGGGRDVWKREVFGEIADKYCSRIVLTNEDPYDEDPRSIIGDMTRGMKRAPEVIMDRREAIRSALARARSGDAAPVGVDGAGEAAVAARAAVVDVGHQVGLVGEDAVAVRVDLAAVLRRGGASRADALDRAG